MIPLAAGPDPWAGDLLAAGWLVPSTESPSATWVGANPEPELTSLRFGRTSMVTPSSVLQIDLETRQETLLKQEPVLGDFDSARYATRRVWAEAPDGTKVPISLVHKKGLALPAPCLLYGYGAYEISIDPTFSPHRLSLLDRGMVYAVAHVRGGGEMGRAWYENGRMEKKANTFSDFIACARHLVAQGITRPDALAGRGGSAGGLLIGAVANEAPELFAALVAQVPFVDVLTTMLDADLPLTVGRVGGMGQPGGRRGGLRPDVLLLSVRQRHGAQPGRVDPDLPEPPCHRRAQRSSRQLLGAGEVGGQNPRPLTFDQSLAAHRNGRRPWRALGAL